MKNKYVSLRVNIKNLADEARNIRLEERRLKGAGFGPDDGRSDRDVNRLYSYNETRHHRVHDVRLEARISQLAYAFVRGVPYRKVEQRTTDQGFVELIYIRRDIAKKVCRHTAKIDVEGAYKDVKEWIDGAEMKRESYAPVTEIASQEA